MPFPEFLHMIMQFRNSSTARVVDMVSMRRLIQTTMEGSAAKIALIEKQFDEMGVKPLAEEKARTESGASQELHKIADAHKKELAAEDVALQERRGLDGARRDDAASRAWQVPR